jgi:pilus assembly protein Flp/PilA
MAVKMLRKFLNDQSGATAIEYAVIAAGVSIVILAAVQSIGAKVGSAFTNVQNGFN